MTWDAPGSGRPTQLSVGVRYGGVYGYLCLARVQNRKCDWRAEGRAKCEFQRGRYGGAERRRAIGAGDGKGRLRDLRLGGTGEIQRGR